MFKKILFPFFITGVIFHSCSSNSKIEGVIDGWWSIDTIYYKDYDVLLCFSSNSIEFDMNGESEFPVAQGNCELVIKNSFERFGKVNLIRSNITRDTIPYRLKIDTENEIFSGEHKIVFHKDEYNQLLKMEIFSEDLYVICRKGLFNFDKNIILINDLEKATWTTRPK